MERWHKIFIQFVEMDFCHTNQRFILDGQPAAKKSSSQHELELPISKLLKPYLDGYPPPKTKLATPVTLIKVMARVYQISDHHSAVVDQVIIDLFFLFRVMGYIQPYSAHQKHTQLLWNHIVKICKNGTVIPQSSSLTSLLYNDSTTICTENQEMVRRVWPYTINDKENKCPQ